jgi:hypothetical protein
MAQSEDPAKRARQQANLLKGISRDRAVRARQIRALTPGKHVHGARAGPQLEESRRLHEQELAVDYPALDRRRRALLADRLSRIQLASLWVGEHGITPDGKAHRGETYAIVDKLDTWATLAENLLAAAEAERGGASVENIDQYVERTYGSKDDAA